MSILRDSSSLTHASLESYIYEACSNNDSIYIYELAKHPNLTTVSQEAIKTLDLFTTGTYPDYIQVKGDIKLSSQQEKQLKKLTILTLFEGRHVIVTNYIRK